MIFTLLACALSLQTTPPNGAPVAAPPTDWRTAEAGTLQGHVQLTFADRFVKAGEAYFSHDDRRIVFQAVEKLADGSEPPPHYAMYVADVVRNEEGGIESL